MPSPPPAGIYVPVPTFFLAPSSPSLDSALDLVTQVQHAVYLAAAGATGLVLLGSTGESIHLTRAERVRLISAVRAGLNDKGFPNLPLLVGTASQSVVETVEQLSEGAAAGAAWGLVLAPGYFAAAGGVSEAGLVAWYKAVADLSVLPILL